MEIAVLYEDDHCLVVTKPSNLIVHHSHYARNIEEDSLVQLMTEQLGYTVYPVHRLDRKTSGVLLFSKDREKVSAFQSLFGNGGVTKKYLALLRGHLPESGVIDSPVKNDRGNYKEALTHYHTLKHYILKIPVVPYDTARYSMVQLIPQTGRMHQLRIHANKISHPIINDPKYGNRHHNHMFEEKLEIRELFLHAESLEFTHPFTNERILIKAELPHFWRKFLEHPLLRSKIVDY